MEIIDVFLISVTISRLDQIYLPIVVVTHIWINILVPMLQSITLKMTVMVFQGKGPFTIQVVPVGYKCSSHLNNMIEHLPTAVNSVGRWRLCRHAAPSALCL